MFCSPADQTSGSDEEFLKLPMNYDSIHFKIF